LVNELARSGLTTRSRLASAPSDWRSRVLQLQSSIGNIKNPIKYTIGAGVTKPALKNILTSIGTTNFQDNKNRFAFINYYGGTTPTKNLKRLIAAGLGPCDLLIWKRLPGISGNFQGHVQTMQSIRPA